MNYKIDSILADPSSLDPEKMPSEKVGHILKEFQKEYYTILLELA
jgi:hypothetical protein